MIFRYIFSTFLFSETKKNIKMGQQTSREHAPLTFGYVNHSNENIERIDTSTFEDAEDFILKNPHLYKLQAICEQCSSTSNVMLSSVVNEACNQCKRQKRLSLVKRDLAEDLEYIDQTYYPDLVHYNTTEEDPMEKELLEFQEQQQQWSKLTIGDAVTPGTNIRRPRRLTGPSMIVDLSNKSLVKLSPSIGYLQNLTTLNL
jgi:predicted DCC family thiol-disulfide oxidoreductase YuxK